MTSVACNNSSHTAIVLYSVQVLQKIHSLPPSPPPPAPSSPALVGNLWDVTDKDIDRYTKALLESITDSSKGELTLQGHVTVTRAACDLLYLTGSAPVVYGLPVLFSCQ